AHERLALQGMRLRSNCVVRGSFQSLLRAFQHVLTVAYLGVQQRRLQKADITMVIFYSVCFLEFLEGISIFVRSCSLPGAAKMVLQLDITGVTLRPSAISQPHQKKCQKRLHDWSPLLQEPFYNDFLRPQKD